MRTTNFSEILYRAITLCGMDRSAIQDSTFRMIRDFATQRISDIWEQEPWPDIVRVEEMNVTTDEDSVASIDITEANGDILNVYQLNPRVTARAVNVSYYLDDSGDSSRIVMLSSTNPVWVEYRLPPPTFFGEAYDASSNYTTGAQIYFDTGTLTGNYQPSKTSGGSGNFYTCLSAGNSGEHPVNTPARWQMVEVPYFTTDYLVRGILSDYLRSESQFESAAIADQEADQAKMMQVDRVLRSEGQVKTMRVFTY